MTRQASWWCLPAHHPPHGHPAVRAVSMDAPSAAEPPRHLSARAVQTARRANIRARMLDAAQPDGLLFAAAAVQAVGNLIGTGAAYGYLAHMVRDGLLRRRARGVFEVVGHDRV